MRKDSSSGGETAYRILQTVGPNLRQLFLIRLGVAVSEDESVRFAKELNRRAVFRRAIEPGLNHMCS